MTSQERKSKLRLSFSQREGIEKLPDSMRPKYLSDDLRRELCDWTCSVLNELLRSRSFYFEDISKEFVQRILGAYFKQPKHYISTNYRDVISEIDSILLKAEYNKVLDFLECFVNDYFEIFFSVNARSNKIGSQLASIFEKHRASYRLDISAAPFEFYEIASQEQGVAVQRAFNNLSEQKHKGATNHLRQAAKFIKGKNYSKAIAESILALESVARAIDPKSSQTLGAALSSLRKAEVLEHSTLEQAMHKLNGFANDWDGARHAQDKSGTVNMGEEEALVMFGACASFAAYLSQKHRKLKNTEN